MEGRGRGWWSPQTWPSTSYLLLRITPHLLAKTRGYSGDLDQGACLDGPGDLAHLCPSPAHTRLCFSLGPRPRQLLPLGLLPEQSSGDPVPEGARTGVPREVRMCPSPKTSHRCHSAVAPLLSRVWLFVTPRTADPRLPCPSPSPGVCSNSSARSQWRHLTISSSILPFSFCLQSSPSSGSFPISFHFTLYLVILHLPLEDVVWPGVRVGLCRGQVAAGQMASLEKCSWADPGASQARCCDMWTKWWEPWGSWWEQEEITLVRKRIPPTSKRVNKVGRRQRLGHQVTPFFLTTPRRVLNLN